MRIIPKQPNPSGAYPSIQSWDRVYAPDEFYEVADGVALSCGGFGTLTVVDSIVTAFTPDVEAWEAWQAEHPVPTPQPTELEELRADFDYLVMVQGVTL